MPVPTNPRQRRLRLKRLVHDGVTMQFPTKTLPAKRERGFVLAADVRCLCQFLNNSPPSQIKAVSHSTCGFRLDNESFVCCPIPWNQRHGAWFFGPRREARTGGDGRFNEKGSNFVCRRTGNQGRVGSLAGFKVMLAWPGMVSPFNCEIWWAITTTWN